MWPEFLANPNARQWKIKAITKLLENHTLRMFSLQFVRVVLSRFFPLLLGSVHLSACIVNYCFRLFFRALLRFHCISCDRPVDMIPGQ